MQRIKQVQKRPKGQGLVISCEGEEEKRCLTGEPVDGVPHTVMGSPGAWRSGLGEGDSSEEGARHQAIERAGTLELTRCGSQLRHRLTLCGLSAELF